MAEVEETISGQATDTVPVTPSPITDEGLNNLLSGGGYTDNPIVAQNMERVQAVDTPIITPAPVAEGTEQVITPPIEGTQTTQPITTPAPSQPQTTFTQSDIDRIVAEKEVEIGKKFEALNTFMEEWNKNPYEVIAKSAPHLYKEFNEIGYIDSKMKEKFGDFQPDANKSLLVGTDDWKYVQELNRVMNEAQQLKNNVVNTIDNSNNKSNESLETYKTTKAQALGMAPDAFNSQIWTKIESMKDDELLDVIVNSLVAINKLGEVKGNITNAVNTKNIPPSPAITSGAGIPADNKDDKLIESLFGKPDMF